MAQPSFSPVPAAGEVRLTAETSIPEIGRPQKAGMQRHASLGSDIGQGTPAPGEGYALTIAKNECAKLHFENHDDAHDVECGIALIAAKRASLIGRGPTLGDVNVALDIFELRSDSVITRAQVLAFVGLGHSYVKQRAFVDSVTQSQLVTT
jgi:hypothetical protein